MIGFLKFQHGSSKLPFPCMQLGWDKSNKPADSWLLYYTFLINMSQMSPNDILLQLAFGLDFQARLRRGRQIATFTHQVVFQTSSVYCNFHQTASNLGGRSTQSNSSQDCTTSSKPWLISSSTIKGVCSDRSDRHGHELWQLQWLMKFLWGWSPPLHCFSAHHFAKSSTASFCHLFAALLAFRSLASHLNNEFINATHLETSPHAAPVSTAWTVDHHVLRLQQLAGPPGSIPSLTTCFFLEKYVFELLPVGKHNKKIQKALFLSCCYP